MYQTFNQRIVKFLLGFIFSFLSLQTIVGQQNYLPLHSYYRDQILVTNRAESYAGDCMFPITEEEYNVYKYFKDSTVYYYNLPEVIFKKHIIEIKDTDVFIKISPVFNFNFGKDAINSFNRNLFQNSKGLLVEGDLGKNFSFYTTLYENQARFSTFESNYIDSRGECYFHNGYYIRYGGIVPGGGRTKIFKKDGYDYAFAVGYINWKPVKNLNISVGNNQHFLGAGYRSMLLSDNSYSSPNIRLDYKLSKKFSFHIVKSRLLNAVRKKRTNTVEAYFQPKGLSVNYISYQPNDKISISFFEGSIWSKGDSIYTTHYSPLFYNPIPFLGLLAKENQRYFVHGLNFSMLLNKNGRVYSQFAIGNLKSNSIAGQIGYRGCQKVFKSNLLYQIEYNFASKNMYDAPNDINSFSQYNLPLAHPGGNGFHELILRSSYEIKRYYFDFKFISYYFTKRQNDFLLPIEIDSNYTNGIQINPNLEVGYRINKKINATVFLNINYRMLYINPTQSNLIFQIGLKTSLIDHYNDY